MKYNQKNLEVWDKFWYFKKILIFRNLGNNVPETLEKKIQKIRGKNIYYSTVSDAKSIWNLSSKLVKLL